MSVDLNDVKIKGQTGDPFGPNYVGPTNLGRAKIDPLGETAILGASAYAAKKPLHILEMVGAVSTDAKNFSDIQSELLSQKGFNPIRKVKNIGRGLKRISNVVRDIANPRQVEVAGMPGLRINSGDVDNVNAMKIDQRLEGFDTTRAQRGKLRTEEITRQRQIQEADLKKQLNLEKGKPNRAESNIREKRGYLGTPTDFTEVKVKEWIDANPDPRIRERIGKSDAYGKPIAEGAATRGEYPQFPGQKQSKKVNAAIKKDLGLEYTVEQHHLIHLRDSATIGKHLDGLNDPITKAATYDYMMKRFGIVPGNFDLNIANIPAGPHRLGVGGDLHTWLDRLGYEDYWSDFSKKWAGKTPTSTDILDAFDLYMDQVFHPMMIKLDDLVKKNPTKGKFEGAYVPQYLVDEAKARVKHLQLPSRPQKLRGTQAGAEEAIEAQMGQAYKSGLGDRGAYYQEKVGDTLITGRRHYRSPDQKKIAAKDLQIKRKKDRLSIANN